MRFMNYILIGLASVGLIFLGACSNGEQAASPENNSTEVKPNESPSNPNDGPKTESPSESGVPQAGGQVVESGAYHLELVPEQEETGTHLDFYLQKGDNHEAIPNAKVTAQVQLPDGSQKTLDLPYDSEGKHYAALLPGKASGQYQVKVTSDIKGEKVDGRFSFNK